jgi:hypothetical protein
VSRAGGPPREAAGDRWISAADAGAGLGMTRQGVAKAVKANRIPGYQDPKNRRIWVDAEYVHAYGTRSGLPERLTRLEATVRELADAMAEPRSPEHTMAGELGNELSSGADAAGDDKSQDPAAVLLGREVTRLRAELVAARAVNVELIAADASADAAVERRRNAVHLLTQAVSELASVDDNQGAEIERLRSAIGQSQLPGTTEDL